MEKPRFSSAKIKKLMQADDEVGRVAAPALTLVGKSLELFAADLISKAAAVMAKDEKSSKTLTAKHIKQCVEAEPLFDFLKTTVSETHAAPMKRARPTGAGSSSSSGQKRKATEAVGSGVEMGGSGSSGGAAAANTAPSLAVAGDYRPLADADDDYDADD